MGDQVKTPFTLLLASNLCNNFLIYQNHTVNKLATLKDCYQKMLYVTISVWKTDKMLFSLNSSALTPVNMSGKTEIPRGELGYFS